MTLIHKGIRVTWDSLAFTFSLPMKLGFCFEKLFWSFIVNEFSPSLVLCLTCLRVSQLEPLSALKSWQYLNGSIINESTGMWIFRFSYTICRNEIISFQIFNTSSMLLLGLILKTFWLFKSFIVFLISVHKLWTNLIS